MDLSNAFETTPISRNAAGQSDASQLALRVVDASLAGTLLLLPWCMGGRHPLGELVLAVLAVAAALAWGVHRLTSSEHSTWRRSPADAIAAGAVLLVLVQLLPLPSAVLNVLSPHLRQLLPLWQSASSNPAALGQWNTISLAPFATQGGLIVALSYALLVLTAIQRIQRIDDIERLLRWTAISVTAMAGFGLVQYFTSNGKFLWFYQHPFRHTFGAVNGMFINKNHFAHLMALGIGPLLWCVQRSFSQAERTPGNDKRWLGWLAALAVVLLAAAMTFSRGGIAMVVLATLVCGGLFRRACLLRGKLLWGAAGVSAALACSLGIHGYATLAQRMEQVTSGSLTELDQDGGRRRIWQTDIKALGDFFISGAGVGSHRYVYPMYLPETLETEFTHAENGYLQIALETGLPGVALLITALVALSVATATAIRHAPNERFAACAAAVTAAMAVSAVHSLVDFAWYIPACMATTLLLVACLLRLHQLSRPTTTVNTWRLPVPLVATACACVAILGMWMTLQTSRATLAAPHWDAYLEFAFSARARQGREEPTADVIEHLQQIVKWTPRDARAHLRLAGACLRRFETLQAQSTVPMPLNQIRDAALASQFTSRDPLDAWLARAIGPRRQYLDVALWHTRRAMANCPLEGEAYVYLAELSFLDGTSESSKPALVDQALRVRPYDGGVLLCAGSEAALAGNLSTAFDFWRRALATGPAMQRQIVDLLAGAQMPAEALIAAFRPDLPVVRLMDSKYSATSDQRQLRPLLEYYAETGKRAVADLNGTEAAALWLELHGVYHRLGQADRELAALERAAALAANNYEIRHALGTALARSGQFAAAEEQLKWCATRKPHDAVLQQLLESTVKSRINASRAPATRTADANHFSSGGE